MNHLISRLLAILLFSYTTSLYAMDEVVLKNDQTGERIPQLYTAFGLGETGASFELLRSMAQATEFLNHKGYYSSSEIKKAFRTSLKQIEAIYNDAFTFIEENKKGDLKDAYFIALKYYLSHIKFCRKNRKIIRKACSSRFRACFCSPHNEFYQNFLNLDKREITGDIIDLINTGDGEVYVFFISDNLIYKSIRERGVSLKNLKENLPNLSSKQQFKIIDTLLFSSKDRRWEIANLIFGQEWDDQIDENELYYFSFNYRKALYLAAKNNVEEAIDLTNEMIFYASAYEEHIKKLQNFLHGFKFINSEDPKDLISLAKIIDERHTMESTLIEAIAYEDKKNKNEKQKAMHMLNNAYENGINTLWKALLKLGLDKVKEIVYKESRLPFKKNHKLEIWKKDDLKELLRNIIQSKDKRDIFGQHLKEYVYLDDLYFYYKYFELRSEESKNFDLKKLYESVLHHDFSLEYFMRSIFPWHRVARTVAKILIENNENLDFENLEEEEQDYLIGIVGKQNLPIIIMEARESYWGREPKRVRNYLNDREWDQAREKILNMQEGEELYEELYIRLWEYRFTHWPIEELRNVVEEIFDENGIREPELFDENEDSKLLALIKEFTPTNDEGYVESDVLITELLEKKITGNVLNFFLETSNNFLMGYQIALYHLGRHFLLYSGKDHEEHTPSIKELINFRFYRNYKKRLGFVYNNRGVKCIHPGPYRWYNNPPVLIIASSNWFFFFHAVYYWRLAFEKLEDPWAGYLWGYANAMREGDKKFSLKQFKRSYENLEPLAQYGIPMVSHDKEFYKYKLKHFGKRYRRSRGDDIIYTTDKICRRSPIHNDNNNVKINKMGLKKYPLEQALLEILPTPFYYMLTQSFVMEAFQEIYDEDSMDLSDISSYEENSLFFENSSNASYPSYVSTSEENSLFFENSSNASYPSYVSTSEENSSFSENSSETSGFWESDFEVELESFE